MTPDKILRLHSLRDGIGLWNHGNGWRSQKKSLLESGYIYAAYISLNMVTIYESNEFIPRREVMSRYARKVVNNRFYGTLDISSLINAT